MPTALGVQAPARPSPGTVPALAPVERPRTAGGPEVVATLDLVSNRSLPGEALPPMQDEPDQILATNASGPFYVRGYLGDALSVVNVSDRAVVATIAAYYSEETTDPFTTMAFDPATGQLWATNVQGENISVVDTATQVVVTSIALAASPAGLAFDPAQHAFFVAVPGLNEVDVINASTDRIATTVNVSAHPESVLYDPADARVFVACVGDDLVAGNVSVVDALNDSLVATLPVGLRPIALALDPTDDLVSVADLASHEVTEIEAGTASYAANLSVGTGDPYAFALDPSSNQLLVANQISDNVTLVDEGSAAAVANFAIGCAPNDATFDPTNALFYVACPQSGTVVAYDPSTNTTPATIPTLDQPGALAVVPATGDLVVVNEGTSTVEANVTLVAPDTELAVRSIPLAISPEGTTYDPASATLAVTDKSGNRTYFVDPSNGTIAARPTVGDLPEYSLYDPAHRTLWTVNVATWNVTVLNSADRQIRTIALGGYPSAAAFDAADGRMFFGNGINGTVEVYNTTNYSRIATLPVWPSADVDALLYDPQDGNLFVSNYSGSVLVYNASTLAYVTTVHTGLDPSGFLFDPENGTVFVVNAGDGNDSVLGGTTPHVVATLTDLEGATDLAYDPLDNGVYGIGTFSAVFLGINASTYAAFPDTLHLGDLSAGGILYDPAERTIDIPVEYNGAVLEIAPTAAVTYSVAFNEVGLPSGTEWTVSLDGVPHTSTNASILFTLPPGNYTYAASAAADYLAEPPTGLVSVVAGNLSRSVQFEPLGAPAYAVDFVEHGLPAGTSWTVALYVSRNSSNGTTLGFVEPNGTYSFAVTTLANYAAAPASGSVNVTGTPVTRPINFTAIGAAEAFSATLTANVSTIGLGGSVAFTTTTLGGTAPFSYLYSGGAGCGASSGPSVVCSPPSVGSFTLSVRVTDATGRQANASATVRVNPSTSVSKGSNTASTLAPWGLVLASLLVVALLVVVAAVYYRRRRRAPPAAAPPPPPPGGPPPPPSG